MLVQGVGKQKETTEAHKLHFQHPYPRYQITLMLASMAQECTQTETDQRGRKVAFHVAENPIIGHRYPSTFFAFLIPKSAYTESMDRNEIKRPERCTAFSEHTHLKTEKMTCLMVFWGHRCVRKSTHRNRPKKRNVELPVPDTPIL